MSDGLRDLELEERSAPPDLRERRPLPDARERGRSAPPPRSGLTVLALVLSVMALIVAGTALALVLRLSQAEPAEEPPEEEEPVTFRFGDKVLTPLEGMPLNPYDKDAFTVDGDGRVTYPGAKVGIGGGKG